MAVIHGDERRVLVIGAGVNGLTGALCLLRSGFQVTVVAEKFAPNITSVVAGGLWEWPPSVCGYHHDQKLLARTKAWCMTSYQMFSQLAGAPEAGVFMREAVFYFKTSVEDDPLQLQKMKEVEENVPGFRHDPALIRENGVNLQAGVKDAYSYLAPMVDTDRYLAWLRREFRDAGGKILTARIKGDLLERERAIRQPFQVDAIVNCAGLGASALIGDRELSPRRGALIRVRNDGAAMSPVTRAHCVMHDTSQNAQDMVFIVPRGENMLLLGGLVEAGEWGLDIDLDNYAPLRETLERCIDFLRALAGARIDPEEPVRVGLRPFRRHNVRLEVEPGTRIIHNYRHGGAGVTLSWGCAQDVVKLVELILEPVAT